ncbi:hypothetical protein [Micromonospora sp. NPDC049282]|uniref:hypothetical protein n=1 Tax=Micromonospora sp. NPDC049282 TaxID=3364269 RepID=UPI00371CFEF7
MTIIVWDLTEPDWPQLRPMLRDMGVIDEPAEAQRARLGHHGDPCPQPDHPTFLLDLGRR